MGSPLTFQIPLSQKSIEKWSEGLSADQTVLTCPNELETKSNSCTVNLSDDSTDRYRFAQNVMRDLTSRPNGIPAPLKDFTAELQKIIDSSKVSKVASAATVDTRDLIFLSDATASQLLEFGRSFLEKTNIYFEGKSGQHVYGYRLKQPATNWEKSDTERNRVVEFASKVIAFIDAKRGKTGTTLPADIQTLYSTLTGWIRTANTTVSTPQLVTNDGPPLVKRVPAQTAPRDIPPPVTPATPLESGDDLFDLETRYLGEIFKALKPRFQSMYTSYLRTNPRFTLSFELTVTLDRNGKIDPTQSPKIDRFKQDPSIDSDQKIKQTILDHINGAIYPIPPGILVSGGTYVFKQKLNFTPPENPADL